MTTDSATQIWVRFEGLGRDFVAKPWPATETTAFGCQFNSFTPPPVDAQALYIAAKPSFAFNGAGDRRVQQIPFKYAKTWGLSEDVYGDVVFARASNKYCMRFVFNLEHAFKGRDTDPYKAYVRLVKDAKFHSDHLEGVKELPVPVHYGLWAMNTGDWAGTVLFSLTQYCGISWNELCDTRFNTEANRISVGRAYEKLHDAGIVHGFTTPSSFRHAIVDMYAPGLTEKDALSGKAPVYIVGFSEASMSHQCGRRLPVLPLDSCTSRNVFGCTELQKILVFLDFIEPPLETSIVSRALEWHTEYSTRYPQVENRYILAAQRKRFYPQFLPLDSSLHVTVPDRVDDLYSRLLITRDIVPDGPGLLQAESQQHNPSSSCVIKSLPPGYEATLAKLRHPQMFLAF
ncbi:hypothetical protein R3P38DRAFT_3553146 [Favolaschia claudopus]|uniref:Protein kinase domain-containing protein n=1 Tax=Favolaschia claudopus TaxID=2862362 RepID=A0AAW0B0K2_9AGAR